MQSASQLYHRFIRLRGDPRQIALGFALGLFVGMSPTMGVQMVIAVFLAALLGWNKIAAATGVWITNPVTAPFIYPVTYWIGARILSLGHRYHVPQAVDANVFVHIFKKAPAVLMALAVGGVMVGAPLAVIGYFLAWKAVVGYRQTVRGRIAEARERISRRKRQKRMQ